VFVCAVLTLRAAMSPLRTSRLPLSCCLSYAILGARSRVRVPCNIAGVQIVVIEANSPAAASGSVMRGDVIKFVDNKVTRVKDRNMSAKEVAKLLQGPPGSKVTLGLKAGLADIREVVLVRQ
jgi:C-terminal processing protease CtpA/Prc